MVRNQLVESINAAMELQKSGKTVRAGDENVGGKDEANPTEVAGAFVKNAVGTAVPEVVANP